MPIPDRQPRPQRLAQVALRPVFPPQLFDELIEDLQPEGRGELLLVETVAICEWRFRRTLRAETAEIVNGIGLGLSIDRVLPNAEAMSNILRYQTTIYRQKMQAVQLLEKFQQRRRNRPPLPPPSPMLKRSEFAKRTQKMLCFHNGATIQMFSSPC